MLELPLVINETSIPSISFLGQVQLGILPSEALLHYVGCYSCMCVDVCLHIYMYLDVYVSMLYTHSYIFEWDLGSPKSFY